MSKNRKQKMITPEIMRQAVVGAFTKLDPRYMMKNPVMFVVEIGFVISLVLSFAPGLLGDTTPNARVYNSIVSAILFVTVLFANFAESVAEGRGKAQAASLKKTKKDTQARLLDADGGERMVPSSELKKGDVVMVSAGGVIPGDGEVIEGIASVDESAITGESAPVVREAGGDFSSVTGGTTVVSDWLKVRITSDPGDSFLDRMIALVEGASRKKTPNEIALNTLLVSLTVIFLIVIVTLYPIALYSGVQLQTSTLIALMVCLIPTTIGGLLSAIGIAGMDRVTRFNVIAMSGKAVEACGDVDTMILDKTGTITYGKERLLRHYRYVLAEHRKRKILYVHAVDQYLPGADVVQADQQVRKRRFSRAGVTDDADHVARLDVEADPVDDLSVLDVGKLNVPERDSAAYLVGHDRVIGFNDVRHGIRDLEQADAGVHAVAEPIRYVDEEVHRTVDHVHISGEADEHTVCHLSAYDHPSAEAEHKHVAEIEDEIRERKRRILEIGELLFVLGEASRRSAEALYFVFLPRERLDHAHSAEDIAERRVHRARA